VRPGINIELAQRIFTEMVARGLVPIDLVLIDNSAELADIQKAARFSIKAAGLWQFEYDAWEFEHREENAKEGPPPRPPPTSVPGPGR